MLNPRWWKLCTLLLDALSFAPLITMPFVTLRTSNDDSLTLFAVIVMPSPLPPPSMIGLEPAVSVISLLTMTCSGKTPVLPFTVSPFAEKSTAAWMQVTLQTAGPAYHVIGYASWKPALTEASVPMPSQGLYAIPLATELPMPPGVMACVGPRASPHQSAVKLAWI